MKFAIPLICCLTLVISSFGQVKLTTQTGIITFNSYTPIEKISASSNQVIGSINKNSGAIEVYVTIQSFQFKNALMQKHFNQNYMESDRFPEATFYGTIKNLTLMQYNTPGTYQAQVTGFLTIHGIEQAIAGRGTAKVTKDSVLLSSELKVKPEDYNINIPALLRDNIAKVIEVQIKLSMKR
ncbi:YceI family protein [Puteibacter caeruleilacunae]|nr:YceI family protein [Puteibacter caeruleilacunae]